MGVIKADRENSSNVFFWGGGGHHKKRFVAGEINSESGVSERANWRLRKGGVVGGVWVWGVGWGKGNSGVLTERNKLCPEHFGKSPASPQIQMKRGKGGKKLNSL